jgi:cilla- and flagella-associated protein
MLREVYIRRNNIDSFQELAYLKDLPNLTTLWLDENPIASAPGYRL